MGILIILLKQIIIMYILIFLGYYCYKKKLVTDEGSKDIGKLLLNIVIPVVILSNFCVRKTAETTKELVYSILISLICMIISVLISIFIYHKKNRIDEFSSAFSNAGFIGIPLVQATLGDHAVFYISMMIVLVNVLQWTYGVYTITDDKSYINIRKITSNPIVIAVIAGIVLQYRTARIAIKNLQHHKCHKHPTRYDCIRCLSSPKRSAGYAKKERNISAQCNKACPHSCNFRTDCKTDPFR